MEAFKVCPTGLTQYKPSGRNQQEIGPFLLDVASNLFIQKQLSSRTLHSLKMGHLST